MTDLRHTLAASIISLAALTAAAQTPAYSQTPGENTGAAPAAALVKSLTAGGVRGDLLTVSPERDQPAGGSAFAQITLSADVTGRKGIDAELLLEAEQGKIAGVTGTGGEPVASGEGQSVRASIGGLRKGRGRSVLVEIKLPQQDAASAKLKVTLSADGKTEAGENATAEITWKVRDCAGGYLSALRQIRDNAELRASERWKEALKADPSLPKSWLFEPASERRSRRRRSDPEVTASSPVKNERAIFTEAVKFMRAGRDTALDRDGNLGWVLGKISQDLDTYLAQPANPAICTGAPKLTDYYSGRLSGLKSRGARLAELAADAKMLAQARTESAFQAARELSEASAGWGGVTPVAAKTMTVRADSLTGMTVSLAELAGLSPEVMAKVKAAETPYQGLELVHDAGLDAEGMPEGIRTALRRAFSALDAGARLEAIANRHAGVQRAFEGRIQAIRDAHAKQCVCAS